MITREDDVEIYALRRQGGVDHRDRSPCWPGPQDGPGLPERQAGAEGRKRAVDPFDPFLDYVTTRLVEDPHLWGVTLLDELQAVGFAVSY